MFWRGSSTAKSSESIVSVPRIATLRRRSDCSSIALLTRDTSARSYSHFSRRALIMLPPTCQWRWINELQGRRLKSVDPTNASSFTSGSVQQLWRDLIHSPPGEKTLNQLKNHFGHRVPVKRLIVAYRRNLNLANLNSYRKLSSHTGLKVSLFIWTVLQVSPYFFHLVPKRRHFSEKNPDFLIEFTGDLHWFVPQIVGQPTPSYRQKSEFECENFR